jgi:hypothetical protein
MVCGAMLFQHPLAIKLLGILPSLHHESIPIQKNSGESVGIVEERGAIAQVRVTNRYRSGQRQLFLGLPISLSSLPCASTCPNWMIRKPDG